MFYRSFQVFSGKSVVARVGMRNFALYGRSHERCQLFRGADAAAPMILCEGVEPYGARPGQG